MQPSQAILLMFAGNFLMEISFGASSLFFGTSLMEGTLKQASLVICNMSFSSTKTEVTEVTTDEEEVKTHPMSVAGPDNEERSNNADEEEDVEENAKRAREDASIAPTLIGVGCIVVIVALAVVVVWKGMVGKKVPNPWH